MLERFSQILRIEQPRAALPRERRGRGSAHSARPSTIVRVPWGRSTLSLNLPFAEDRVRVCEPHDLPAVSSLEDEVRRALQAPSGMPPLRELAAGKARVLIVVDDSTRSTPTDRMIGPVFDILAQAGVRKEAISIIGAVGVHRPMTDAEFAAKLGKHWSPALRILHHDYANPDALVDLGPTFRGNRAVVSKHLLDADLIVGFGSIEPHVAAGFGGGYKLLFPGLGGARSIEFNHGLHKRPEHFNMVGTPPAQNPMRCDLEEVGRKLPRPVFILNAVANGDLQVVEVVAGDPIEAHRLGIRKSAEIFGVEIERQADLVVANSFPMDADLRQSIKSIGNVVRALRKGGVMLSLLKAERGIGDAHPPRARIPIPKWAARPVFRVLSRAASHLSVGGPENNFMLYAGLQMLGTYRVVSYAPALPKSIAGSFPFLDVHDQLEGALTRVRHLSPTDASVLVFPRAGVTFPLRRTPHQEVARA